LLGNQDYRDADLDGDGYICGVRMPSYNCSAQSEIPEAECEALVRLYDLTNGPGWRRSAGWVESNAPCSWHGVTCEGGSVSWLYLRSNELTGPIPSALGNLRGLQYLDLAGNQLTGVIPYELPRQKHPRGNDPV